MSGSKALGRRWIGDTVLLAVIGGGFLVALTPEDPAAAQPAVPSEVSVELVEERTASAKFYVEPNGDHVVDAFAGEVHYRAPDGEWTDIDPTLVASSEDDFAWETKNAPLSVALAGVARADDLARVETASGGVVEFGPERVQTISPSEIEGVGVRYSEIEPGVDLVLEPRADSLKELIILEATPDGPVAYEFRLSLENLTPRLERSGEISLIGESGKVELVIPHGSMEDSLVDENSDEPAFSESVRYELEPAGDDYILTVIPDLEWLQDAARVYPVQIDPSFTDPLETWRDLFIQTGITSSQEADTELKAGTFDGGTTKARSLLRFGITNLELEDAHIISAELSIRESHSWSCSKSTVNVHRITEVWPAPGASHVNWANQPSVYGTPVDGVYDAKGYSASCPAGRIEFDVTELVRNWIKHPDTHPNRGLELRANDETNNNGWKKFNSVETTYTPAYISVEYNHYPISPTGRSPANATVADEPNPTLSAQFRDPDSGDGRVDYQVCTTASCSAGTIVAAGSGPQVGTFEASPWTVPPASSLTSGQRYWWRARSNDGVDESGWTATWEFIPDRRPETPSRLDPASGLVTAATPTLAAAYEDLDGSPGRIEFRIYHEGTLASSGTGTTVSPGEKSRWTVPAGILADGLTYSWRAWAVDEWQQPSAVTEDRTFLMSVGPDVYHAMAYTRDPAAGGEFLAEEWARINTVTARSEDTTSIMTRSPAACPSRFPAGTACSQVRSLTTDDPNDSEAHTVYVGQRDELSLDQVASILVPAEEQLPAPVETGPLASALASWQDAPPSAGSAFERFVFEDDENPGGTISYWVESRTRMPLRESIYAPGGELLATTYWTYDATRIDAATLPTDFFSVPRPATVGYDEYVEIHSDHDLPALLDRETESLFEPYYLGASPALLVDGGEAQYCFDHVLLVEQQLAVEQSPIPEEPEFEPAPSGPQTYAVASYRLSDDGLCPHNDAAEEEETLQIMSMADVGSMAEAYRLAYVDPAEAIQANPLDSEFSRGGTASSFVQGTSTIAYVLSVDIERSSVLLEPSAAASMVIVTGTFDKTTTPSVMTQITQR